MELVEITQRPSISSFTPLSQHQEETPSTFFGGLAVLHAYAPEAKLLIQQRQYDETPSVQKLGAVEAVAAGYAEISELEVWVTSRNLIIFSPSKSAGIQVPYQSIAINALSDQDSQTCVLLEISPPEPDQIPNQEDLEYLELKLIPLSLSEEAHHETENGTADSNGVNGNSAADLVKVVFNAISACSELNPDPDMDEEEPSFGTGGGWITAENMDQYLDAEGQFVGGQTLGTGAGTVRAREEVEDERFEDDEEYEEGEGGEGDATKWRRTE